MNVVKFEPNSAGIQALLKRAEMMAICKGYADKAAAQLGDGYIVTTYNGKTRVNASVKAETYEAKRDNLENNSIYKAVYGQ